MHAESLPGIHSRQCTYFQKLLQHTLSLMLTIALIPCTILLSLIPYRCHDAYMDFYTSYEHIRLNLLPFLDFFGKVCHQLIEPLRVLQVQPVVAASKILLRSA